MTTSFKHGNSTYLFVVAPSGMREGEQRAKDLQADPKLWASAKQKQSALGLRLEDERKEPKPTYVRKNPEQRREAARLRMRKLRQERRAA